MKMEANPSQICRLCLQSSVDPVNIWQTLEDLTIASILMKYFWFQPHKDDNMSEWLCQSCWIHTETFHHFYERIQRVHEQTLNGDVPDSRPSTDNEDDEEEDDEEEEDDRSNASDHEDTNIKRNLRPTLSHTDRLAKNEKEDVQIREIFPMKCNKCDNSDVTFKTWDEVRYHYRKVHNMSGYLVCCGRKFSTRYHIMQHVLRHVNPKAHQCDQCDRVCSNKFALKSHIEAAHAPRDTRIFKCTSCPSSFVTAGVLRVHVLNKHSDSGEQFPCDECGKSYRSLTKLKSHQRLIHNTTSDHVCEICARQHRTKGALKRHILNQHSTTPHPKLQCSICGAWLTKPSLKRHMQSMHDDAYKAVKCTMCDKLVKNKFALPKHMRSVHGGRRHQCVQCDKAFKNSTQLEEHIACHTGQSRYNCPYCDQKFKANANYFAHRRRKHFAEYTKDRDAGIIRNFHNTEMEADYVKTENV